MKNIQYILALSLMLTACGTPAKAEVYHYQAARGDDKGDAYEDSVEAVEETIYIKENTESQK